jgi:hypothetical protein
MDISGSRPAAFTIPCRGYYRVKSVTLLGPRDSDSQIGPIDQDLVHKARAGRWCAYNASLWSTIHLAILDFFAEILQRLSNGEWGLLATIARKGEKHQFPKIHTLRLADNTGPTPIAADSRIRSEVLFTSNNDKGFDRFIRYFTV